MKLMIVWFTVTQYSDTTRFTTDIIYYITLKAGQFYQTAMRNGRKMLV